MKFVLILAATTFVLLSCGKSTSNSEMNSVDDIVSMKKLPDGRFKVVCRDGTSEIVTSSDLLANNVCEPKNSIVISGGTYKPVSGHHVGTNCRHEIKPFYSSKSLNKLRIKFVGACKNAPIAMKCKSNNCTFSGTEIFEVKLLSNTTYHFRRGTKISKMQFSAPPAPKFKGILKNVELAPLLQNWKICLRTTYYNRNKHKIRDVKNRCAGKKILMGCKEKNNPKFKLLAMLDKDFAFQFQGKITSTVAHNDIGYYHLTSGATFAAIGFARKGDPVQLAHWDYQSNLPNQEDRMSWLLVDHRLYGDYGRCGKLSNTSSTSKRRNMEQIILYQK